MIFSGELLEHARKTALDKELSLTDIMARYEAQFQGKALTKAGVRGWERGQHEPKANVLGELAEIYNLCVCYFFIRSAEELEDRISRPAIDSTFHQETP